MGPETAQILTGGVLGAVLSAAVMGARRIFSRGDSGMQKSDDSLVVDLKTQVFLRDALFLQKSWPFFTLKTQVFTVTINEQNIVQHFQGKQSALKTFHFFEGAPVFVEGGLCHGTMAQWSVQAWNC